MMKRIGVLTPFLFTLASLLQLNYVAIIVASPVQIVRPLLALWALLLFLFLPLYLVLRDLIWVSLLLTVFVAGFYFSSSFFSTASLFALMTAILWLLFLRFRRIKVNAGHFLLLLFAISLFFTGFSIFLMSRLLSTVPWDHYQQSVSKAKTYSLIAPSTPQRDIYLIILDGYGRADVLQELYRFDNTKFTTYLEEQGFIIPPSAVSNYPATHLSVASILNMDYVPSFAPRLEQNYQRWLMSPFIDHGRVRAFLEQQGYRTVSISTNWSITDNPTTDLYFQPYPVMLNDFEGFLLDSTPLQLFEPLMDRFVGVPSFETHRHSVRYNFEILADLPKLPGPKFVVAHIISPHPPFVFDENGNPVDIQDSFSFKDADEYSGSGEEYRKMYLSQLRFVNTNMVTIVESILANSKTPPIIIIQADHGPGMLVDFASSENTCIKERFSIFAGYYLPDVDPNSIPSDISAVNIFRIIFNEYFDARLSILESRQYFYEKPVSFYDFEDVTTRRNETCEPP